jgi:hypothetical protein
MTQPWPLVRFQRWGPIAKGFVVYDSRSSGPRQKQAATFHEMHQKLPPSCAPIEGPLELPSGGDSQGPDCFLASTANLESRAVGASHFGLSSFP